MSQKAVEKVAQRIANQTGVSSEKAHRQAAEIARKSERKKRGN